MTTIGSAQNAADMLGVTVGRVRQLCQAGRVRDAKRIGDTWIIPMPPEVAPPRTSRRRPGKFAQGEQLPAFLHKRLPKAREIPC